MAEYIIRCVAAGSGAASPYDGMYLKRYLPEAHDGQGEAEWTADLAEAVTFPDALAARQAWMHIPVSRPTREDGNPNRPLTAFSVSIERIRDEQGI